MNSILIVSFRLCTFVANSRNMLKNRFQQICCQVYTAALGTWGARWENDAGEVYKALKAGLLLSAECRCCSCCCCCCCDIVASSVALDGGVHITHPNEIPHHHSYPTPYRLPFTTDRQVPWDDLMANTRIVSLVGDTAHFVIGADFFSSYNTSSFTYELFWLYE